MRTQKQFSPPSGGCAIGAGRRFAFALNPTRSGALDRLRFKAFAILFFVLAAGPALRAAEPAPPSEAELIEKQRIMEKDLERAMQNLMDKVFGPNQSEVKATINLSIQTLTQKKSGSGEQNKQKEENPLGETKFLLPGVPAPKNVNKEKEPENTAKMRVEQERAQSQISFKVIVSRRDAIVFYNERLKDKEPEARKAILAMTEIKDPELKFIPGKFVSSTFWQDAARDPKNLIWSILLFLLFLALLWLFLPLMGFLRNYLQTLKEKGGIEVKMESTEQEENMGGEGLTPEELLRQQAEEEAKKEGEEEMAKKYVPFEYITEENLNRLLGVFTKEPPQVIALILSYLKPELVRKIYAELPVDVQSKVAIESGALRQATEEQVRMVDENIKAKIDFLVGGVDNLIRILEEVDYKIRDNILEYLTNHRPQLYEKVRSSILLFEDTLNFPDAAIQPIIRELKTEQLARALRNASPEIVKKFISNMSQGGAALLKEEMEYGRPAADDQIELERQNILNTIKRLEAEGKVHVREKKKISVFDSEDATSPLLPSMPEEDYAGVPGGASPEAGGNAAEAEGYLSYGSQLYSEQRYADAVPYLQYALRSDPRNAAAYQLLGHCHYGLGQTAEALQCYEAALRLNPADEAMRQWVEQFKQNAGV